MASLGLSPSKKESNLNDDLTLDDLDLSWPDPIMKLDRVIGFSGKYHNCLLWAADGSSVVFPSVSTIIILTFPSSDEKNKDDKKRETFPFPSSPVPESAEGPYFVNDTFGNQEASKSIVSKSEFFEKSEKSDENGSENEAPTQRFLFGHTSPVCTLALSPDSTLLASGQEGKNPVLRLWHYATGTCCAVLKAQVGSITSIHFAPQGRQFCSVRKQYLKN